MIFYRNKLNQDISPDNHLSLTKFKMAKEKV
ncbi:hypothetical protein SVI_3466 [Shewanella violacea DSS12]|uniref:Uncharacterized protein n=1 Tax=Shewanella violacea (strain JCM 10179 / CIP 106290 / LMG 19151 / DSS12) TaxID=637905 RepID=D4ZBP2_SHEVD|nr:hypothetical protein SVI_3466 [Shewanella violacea DSS12]